MALEHVGYVDLPPHAGAGGFDHAAVHGPRCLLYVAHTANDAVDVVDCASHTYLRSIPRLPRVAGALVSDAHDLVFTSNRGEDTVAIVRRLESVPTERGAHTIGFDATRNTVYAFLPDTHRAAVYRDHADPQAPG